MKGGDGTGLRGFGPMTGRTQVFARASVFQGSQTFSQEGVSMAKHKIVCPFSGTACKECAVYRGRHYYLCYSAAYRGSSFDPERIRELKIAETPDEPGKTFGMPEKIDVGAQCVRNVEEYGIEKEFAALKQY